MSQRLGLAGALAKRFQNNAITPLLALVGLLLGVFAVLVTPQEEEPQIDVTFANVFVPFPGATAKEVEQQISIPAEQVLSEIAGVKHVYSVSQPGMAVLSVQFKVGEARTQALVRLYNKVYSNQDFLPANLGAGQPLVKPKGIDDVPIVSLTLWTPDPHRGATELGQSRTRWKPNSSGYPAPATSTRSGPRSRWWGAARPGTPGRLRFIAGRSAPRAAGRQCLHATPATWCVTTRTIAVQAGSFLCTPSEIAQLVVGLHHGAPMYLSDVAEVRLGPEQPRDTVRIGSGPAASRVGIGRRSIPGGDPGHREEARINAVNIADQVIARVHQLQGTLIPAGVHVTVTRDYGTTAAAKAHKLIGKLIFATSAVVVLVLLALGWREAIIVGLAVVPDPGHHLVRILGLGLYA